MHYGQMVTFLWCIYGGYCRANVQTNTADGLVVTHLKIISHNANFQLAFCNCDARIAPNFKSVVAVIMSWFQNILASCTAFLAPKVERTAAQQQKADRLANSLTLYTLNSCPYSAKVTRHLNQLNINVTVKNLKRCHIYQKELLVGGGRAQVPCLRIESSQGCKWMYESDDILMYLDKKFLPKGQVEALKQAH